MKINKQKKFLAIKIAGIAIVMGVFILNVFLSVQSGPIGGDYSIKALQAKAQENEWLPGDKYYKKVPYTTTTQIVFIEISEGDTLRCSGSVTDTGVRCPGSGTVDCTVSHVSGTPSINCL